MGLDNRVLQKPKEGFEEEFDNILRNYIKKGVSDENVIKRYFEITIPAYENLNAPVVGRDKEANEWVMQHYDKDNSTDTPEEFIKKNAGYNVLQLVRCDGLPKYIALGQDPYVFRGKFLNMIEEELGDYYIRMAYQYMSAFELKTYGEEILILANNYAKEHNTQHVKGDYEENYDDGPEFNTHLMRNFGRWCVFWGNKGHGMEPDY